MAEDLTGQQVVDKITAANKAFKEEVVLKAKQEVEATNKEVEAIQKDFETVKKELEAKGATIIDLQDKLKDMNAKGGRVKLLNRFEAHKSMIESIADSIGENKEIFVKMASGSGLPDGGIKIEQKVSTVTTSSLTGTGAPYMPMYLDWRPGMEPLGQTRFRSLAPILQSDNDTVYYPRANTPPGAGSIGYQASEGATKAQVDRGWAMQTLTLLPLAGWMTVSRQSLRNISFLQSWLPTSLTEQLLDQEDLEFANTLVAAATGSSTTTGITVKAERLIFFIKTLKKSKYNATAIAVDPDIWATILVTKPNDYSLPGVVSITADGTVRILGVPLYPVNWLTGGRCIVGDWTKTAVVESEGLTLRQSDSATSLDFQKNLVTFLIERTEGVAIFRPDAFITAIV
jgi:HK97 family phage major capsid protein